MVDVMVVVVVRMEEEMEGRMVVEMVVEKREAGHGKAWAAVRWPLVGRRRRRINERERRKVGVYIKEFGDITSLSLEFKTKETQK